MWSHELSISSYIKVHRTASCLRVFVLSLAFSFSASKSGWSSSERRSEMLPSWLRLQGRGEKWEKKRKEKKREAEKQKQSFLINPFRPVETKSWERTWKNWPNWYIQTHLKTHFSEFLPGLVFLTFWIIVVLLVWFSALFSDVSDLSDILLCL